MGTSTISAGTVIRGRIRADGDLVVEGQVEGAIEASGAITIAEGALVKSEDGAIVGSSIAVAGAVNGSLQGSEAVVLEPGARVVGDVAAPSIGVRPGALVRGRIDTTGGAAHKPAGRAQPARAAAPAPIAKKAPPAAKLAPPARKEPAAPPPPVVPALKKRVDKAARRKGR